MSDRAAVGDIVAADAGELAATLLNDCRAIAARQGFAPRPTSIARSREILTAHGSLVTVSMLHDVEKDAPAEADDILGNLLMRSGEDARGLGHCCASRTLS